MKKENKTIKEFWQKFPELFKREQFNGLEGYTSITSEVLDFIVEREKEILDEKDIDEINL